MDSLQWSYISLHISVPLAKHIMLTEIKNGITLHRFHMQTLPCKHTHYVALQAGNIPLAAITLGQILHGARKSL